VFSKKSAVGYLFFLIAGLAAAQIPASSRDLAHSGEQQRPELNTIVQRMEQAARENRDRYRAYVITREYRMYGGEARQPTSTVLADISFVPPKTQDYKITESQGSSRGETVVRHILEGEQKAAETGHAPGAVSSENYDFKLESEQRLDGHDCFVLGIKPKRMDEKNMIVGQAWVDKDTYLVRRVQGQLSKMPSWWIKSAEVTLDFGDVSGMWLQTRTVAKADVRIVGPHTLTQNAVKIRTGSTVAEVIPQRKMSRRPFRQTEAVIGTIEH
jgi:hypothetical protein